MNTHEYLIAFKNHWKDSSYKYLVDSVELFINKYPLLTYSNPTDCTFQASGRLTKACLLDLIAVAGKTKPDELEVTKNSFRMWWD